MREIKYEEKQLLRDRNWNGQTHSVLGEFNNDNQVALRKHLQIYN